MVSISRLVLLTTLLVASCLYSADDWRELTTVKGTVVYLNSDEFVIESKDAKIGIKTYPLHKISKHVQVDAEILRKLEKKRDVATLEKYARIRPSQLPPGAKVEVYWHDTQLTKDGRVIQNLDFFQVRLLKLLDEDTRN